MNVSSCVPFHSEVSLFTSSQPMSDLRGDETKMPKLKSGHMRGTMWSLTANSVNPVCDTVHVSSLQRALYVQP